MAAVRLALRAELSAHWRRWLGLAVVAGLAGGLVVAAAAGARRTDSALARYLAFSRANDVIVGTGAVFGNQGLDLARIRRLPQVAAAARGILPAQEVRSRTGRDVASTVAIETSPDAANLTTIDRPKLLAGRMPAQTRPDEAVADRRALRLLGVALGDAVQVRVFVGRDARPGPLAPLRIVGVRPDSSSANVTSFLSTTPAFYGARGGSALAVAAWRSALLVRLRHGEADLDAFQREVERIAGGRDFQFTPAGLEAAKMQSPLHLQAQALWITAALGGIGALLLLGQGLARATALASRKHPMMLALGMTRPQLASLALTRVAMIGVAAAVITPAVAIALSPLAPIERARDYEPRPGIAVDALVVSTGTVLVLLAALLGGAIAAASAMRTRPLGARTADRPMKATRAATLAGAGLPPAIAAGVRMATAGGRARATMLGAVLAVAVATAALTFSGSLARLLETPGLSGVTWDYATYQGSGTSRDLARLRSDASIADVSYGQEATLDIGGRRMGAAAYDVVKGHVQPTVLRGRAPTASNEVLLGAKTFDALHAHIGARVLARRGDRAVTVRVVGSGILPEDEWLGQGEGAAMTFATLRQLVPGAFRSRFLIRLAPGAEREAVLHRLEVTYGIPRPGLPADIADFGGVRGMPVIIAILVGAVASTALAWNLLTSVAVRRRELAILKTLGFTSGQVRATVAWQATTVAAIGTVVGVPLGLGAGRWAWNGFAGHLGVAPLSVTPLGKVLIAVPAALLLANVLAAFPARVAARTRPGAVLRAE